MAIYLEFRICFTADLVEEKTTGLAGDYIIDLVVIIAFALYLSNFYRLNSCSVDSNFPNQALHSSNYSGRSSCRPEVFDLDLRFLRNEIYFIPLHSKKIDY